MCLGTQCCLQVLQRRAFSLCSQTLLAGDSWNARPDSTEGRADEICAAKTHPRRSGETSRKNQRTLPLMCHAQLRGGNDSVKQCTSALSRWQEIQLHFVGSKEMPVLIDAVLRENGMTRFSLAWKPEPHPSSISSNVFFPFLMVPFLKSFRGFSAWWLDACIHDC